jgi:hypothetical protein
VANRCLFHFLIVVVLIVVVVLIPDGGAAIITLDAYLRLCLPWIPFDIAIHGRIDGTPSLVSQSPTA